MDELNDLQKLQILIGASGLSARELSAKEQTKLDAIRAELRAIRSDQDRQRSLPQCPVCGGRLEGQFRKCMHCTADLVWLEGLPCEPGKEQELLDKLNLQRKVLREAHAKAEAEVRAKEVAARELERGAQETERKNREGVQLIDKYNAEGWVPDKIAAKLAAEGYLQRYGEQSGQPWNTTAVMKWLSFSKREVIRKRDGSKVTWGIAILSAVCNALVFYCGGRDMVQDLGGFGGTVLMFLICAAVVFGIVRLGLTLIVSSRPPV